ncbi:MAG TPA: chromosomal replication initiator protein DnaA [Candidatus Bathyarchaeia archaeon]|nr:chromosomal replication initiator protein DnaA [Candidatus Bathyarchaeia archaeon]
MSTLDHIWNQFLYIVAQEVGSRVVETWFKAITVQQWDVTQKTVYIKVPNTFVKNWVQTNYYQLLQTHLGRLLHVDKPTIMLVDDTNVVTISPEIQEKKPLFHAAHVMQKNNQSSTTSIVPSTAQSLTKNKVHPFHEKLSSTYSFETFVVGPNNSLAFAAAHAVAKKPGSLYNPLFIYGGSGLGKTHLLRAIGYDIQKEHKDAVVLYNSAHRFVNEFIYAIRFDKVLAFQKKYQSVDVLLVDDIQFISNKEQTQEAFFHIFNALYDAQKQVVFSSDTVPYHMQGIAERLRTRLSGGLITDIHMPALETKIAILKKKADLNGHELPDDVAHFIASCTVSNIRELEGMFIRVMAYACLAHQKITLDLAKKVITTPEKEYNTIQTVEFQQILSVLKKYYSYELTQLCSKDRDKDTVFVRHVAMYLMKKLTNKSFREIGDFLGGRDHTTVMHALEKIERQLQKDEQLSRTFKQIERELML